ncbi:MAG: L,D-transpeptidase, partial [Armatimonadota bacterium]
SVIRISDYRPLKITSSFDGIEISKNTKLEIAWQCDLYEAASYALSYSLDGESFSNLIADKLQSNKYDWNITNYKPLKAWIKVKAFDCNGHILAEDICKMNLIPNTSIVVSKEEQKVYHYHNGNLKNVFVCSTALPQYDLKEGNYKVYLKVKKHWSKLYEVWMPNTLFFHRGYALHATEVINKLGIPASHGCVRLHPRDALTLYNSVSVGTPVIVLPKKVNCAYFKNLNFSMPPQINQALIAKKDTILLEKQDSSKSETLVLNP